MPSRTLPARPSLEPYKKQSKQLVTAYRAGDAEATRRVRTHHPRFAKGDDSGFKLAGDAATLEALLRDEGDVRRLRPCLP